MSLHLDYHEGCVYCLHNAYKEPCRGNLTIYVYECNTCLSNNCPVLVHKDFEEKHIGQSFQPIEHGGSFRLSMYDNVSIRVNCNEHTGSISCHRSQDVHDTNRYVDRCSKDLEEANSHQTSGQNQNETKLFSNVSCTNLDEEIQQSNDTHKTDEAEGTLEVIVDTKGDVEDGVKPRAGLPRSRSVSLPSLQTVNELLAKTDVSEDDRIRSRKCPGCHRYIGSHSKVKTLRNERQEEIFSQSHTLHWILPMCLVIALTNPVLFPIVMYSSIRSVLKWRARSYRCALWFLNQAAAVAMLGLLLSIFTGILATVVFRDMHKNNTRNGQRPNTTGIGQVPLRQEPQNDLSVFIQNPPRTTSQFLVTLTDFHTLERTTTEEQQKTTVTSHTPELQNLNYWSKPGLEHVSRNDTCVTIKVFGIPKVVCQNDYPDFTG